MSASRWIVVDDTDPAIQYEGPWFVDSAGSQNALGNFGPPYQNTLHGATLNASLAYHFSGSQVSVFGSNNLLNSSGVLDPSWECFVDGISIGATSPFQFPENNWLFCSQNTLVDGPHILTVNATVRKSQTFWFDQIQYVPSSTVPLDEKAILIDHLDPQLQTAYGSGWVALGGSANMTSQMNSVFTFDFTGVSLSWYGFIPTEFPHGPSTGSYSVDQGTSVKFPLAGLPANSATIFNQKFFQTANLTQGKHQIVVVFDGNSQTTPLTLDCMIIQNGSISATTTSSTISFSSTNSPSSISVNQTSAKNNRGIVMGGVIGGLVLITLTILISFCIRRRRNRIQLKGNSGTFAVEPQPFVYSPVPIMNSMSTLHGGQMPSSSLATVNKSNLLNSVQLTSSPRLQKMQREAKARAVALRPHRQNNGVLPSLPLSDGSAPSRVLMHEDGGIQLRGDPAETMQEIPPQYTAT